MRIGLNATCFNDRPSGARQRFEGIYRELVRLRADDEFILFEPADCRVGGWFEGAGNVAVRRTPVPSQGRAIKAIEGLRYWPGLGGRERLDLFEGFNLPFTTAKGAANVLTIHDIRGVYRDYPAANRLVFKTALRRALDAADLVLAVSNAVRDEILAFHPGASVSVVYNGIDAAAFEGIDPEAAARVRAKHILPDDFILAVGHLEPRKNYIALIEALALLKERRRDASLVIVGNDSGLRASIEKTVAQHGLQSRVRLLSALSEADVQALYHLSRLFVFPSVYEGFGIPLLEAMAAGRAMAISDIPVFREIADGCGIFFDPSDVGSMADAIERGLTSEADRERLVAAGRERVKAFGFKPLAQQVSGIYDALARRS